MISLFLALVVTHFLVDFPLQGDFLARGKNHRAPLPGVPWAYCLFAHAALCGAAVALCVHFLGATKAPMAISFGLAEALIHAGVDLGKNEGAFGKGETGFLVDQALHLLCKLTWAYLCGPNDTAGLW